MPPKVKTSKEDVIKAALKVAEKEGVAAISAKKCFLSIGNLCRTDFQGLCHH